MSEKNLKPCNCCGGKVKLGTTATGFGIHTFIVDCPSCNKYCMLIAGDADTKPNDRYERQKAIDEYNGEKKHNWLIYADDELIEWGAT